MSGIVAPSPLDALPSLFEEYKSGPGKNLFMKDESNKMSEGASVSPLDAMASLFDEYKSGPGKNLSIIRSSSAVVSLGASALLVWILFRSRNGIKTTYHRLLLGLSISDMLYSLSVGTFGAVVPSELSYVVWNARGSQASCDTFGFVGVWGGGAGLIYMCSLNLYYLAKVKFDKTDYYIAAKLEPWLLGVPTLYGLIVSIVLLAKHRMNAAIDGICGPLSNYDPPHCEGHEDGDIPEGFQIPCGRGRSAELIAVVTGFVTLFLVPITIGGSLWTIYRSVSRAEQRMAQYGARALRHPTTNDATTTNVEGGDSGGRGASSMFAVTCRLGGRAFRRKSNNQVSFKSRAVLHRAAAYSVAYFVTWMWLIIYSVAYLAGAWTTDLPEPKWQIVYSYVSLFFQPLQGLWTILIYIQPNVIKRKRLSDGKISWFRAFADALWSAVTGGNNSARRRRDRAGPGTPRTAAAPCTEMNPTSAPVPKGRNTSATVGSTVGSTDRQGICARDPGAPGTAAAPGSSATKPALVPGAGGTGAPVRAVHRENRLVQPEDEEDEEVKREMEPYQEDDGGDDMAGAVVGDGYESFREYMFGPSDPHGPDTVVGVGFENFIAYLRGPTDPQGGLDREESVGLEAEGAE